MVGGKDIATMDITKLCTFNIALPEIYPYIYVRISTQIEASMEHVDYQLKAKSPPANPKLLLPKIGDTINGDFMVKVTKPSNVKHLYIYVSTKSLGKYEVMSKAVSTAAINVSLDMKLLPKYVYLRIWHYKTSWAYKDYTFDVLPPADVTLLEPTPGSKISGDFKVKVQRLPAVKHVYLYVSASRKGGNELYAKIVRGDQANISFSANNYSYAHKLYIRVWAYKTKWEFQDYTFQI